MAGSAAAGELREKFSVRVINPRGPQFRIDLEGIDIFLRRGGIAERHRRRDAGGQDAGLLDHVAGLLGGIKLVLIARHGDTGNSSSTAAISAAMIGQFQRCARSWRRPLRVTACASSRSLELMRMRSRAAWRRQCRSGHDCPAPQN